MATINEYNRYSESPTLTNKTPDYNQMYNFSRPTKVQDFINNKNNIIHTELYNFALERFIDDHVSSNVTNNMIVNIFNWLKSIIIHINDMHDDEDNKEDKIIEDLLNGYVNLMFNDIYKTKSLKVLRESIIELSIDRKEFLKQILTYIFIGDSEISQIRGERDPFIGIYNIYKAYQEWCNDNNSLGPFETLGSFINIENYIYSVSYEDDMNVMSEYYVNDDGYIILYEEEDNTKKPELFINFNNNGLLILTKLNEETGEYEELVYENDEDIPENIQFLLNHIQTFNYNFLYNLIDDTKKKYIKYHKFIELKPDEFQYPGSVFVISRVEPFTRSKYSLNDYWNTTQYKSDYVLNNIAIDFEHNNLLYELESINYVTGKVKYKSKLTDREVEVDFNYFDPYALKSDSFNNTFTKIHSRI